jgi:predicted dehydrogenase
VQRVLVVGVGSIGARHVRCFQNTGRAEIGICETLAERAESVANRYGLTAIHTTLSEALDAPYDLAVICTPAHLHVSQASAALAAGKHVLIEKPLSTSEEGVADLIRQARDAGRVAGVAYVQRCHPVLADMKAAIDSGRFGRIVQVVAVSGQHFPTYRPAYREIYYRSRATGGGAVQDALTHMMNAGQWLAGPIDRLCADLAHQILPDVEVEDTVHVLARHGDALACYALNQHQAPNELCLTVVCSRGTVRYEAHRGRWSWMTEPGGEWQTGLERELERDTVFERQAELMLDAVEDRAAPRCSLEEAWRTLRVNLAILAAADSGKWHDVRPLETQGG